MGCCASIQTNMNQKSTPLLNESSILSIDSTDREVIAQETLSNAKTLSTGNESTTNSASIASVADNQSTSTTHNYPYEIFEINKQSQSHDHIPMNSVAGINPKFSDSLDAIQAHFDLHGTLPTESVMQSLSLNESVSSIDPMAKFLQNKSSSTIYTDDSVQESDDDSISQQMNVDYSQEIIGNKRKTCDQCGILQTDGKVDETDGNWYCNDCWEYYE